MANHNIRKERHEAEKAARRKSEFDASHRFARMAGTKVRLVADQIRGLNVNKALETLKYSKKRGAAYLLKVVKSALSNAEYRISEDKLDLDLDNLHVADVQIDEGPTMKRWMTRSRGMAYPILKRFCHIHLTLKAKAGESGEGGEAGKAAAEAGTGAKTKKGKKAMAGAK